jgi:hypothetical protein
MKGINLIRVSLSESRNIESPRINVHSALPERNLHNALLQTRFAGLHAVMICGQFALSLAARIQNDPKLSAGLPVFDGQSGVHPGGKLFGERQADAGAGLGAGHFVAGAIKQREDIV